MQYVWLCVNTFNYLACYRCMCAIVLTGILIESLCEYWSTYSGSCPIFYILTKAKPSTPSSPVQYWLTNLGYPWLTTMLDLFLIPQKLFGYPISVWGWETENNTGKEAAQGVHVPSFSVLPLPYVLDAHKKGVDMGGKGGVLARPASASLWKREGRDWINYGCALWKHTSTESCLCLQAQSWANQGVHYSHIQSG